MGYDGHPSGCTCATCSYHRRLRRESSRRCRARQRSGEDSRLTAEAVVAHVRELRSAGLTQYQIAEAAGVAKSVLSKALHGRTKRVHPATAQAVLGLTVSQVRRVALCSPLSHIPPTGTARRLEALAVQGHSLNGLARRLGTGPSALRAIANGTQAHVTIDLAERVAALYDRLWNVDGASVRARNEALAKGWVPPMAWDDDTIDNPQAKPLPYARRTRNRRGRDLTEEAAELLRQGLTRAQAAERLGTTHEAINAAFHRHGNPNDKDARHDVA